MRSISRRCQKLNEELKVVISAEISKLKSEVDNAKKAIGDFTKSSTDKVKNFSETVKEQTDTLKDLKQKYADVVAVEGKNSESAKKLASEIKSCSKELKNNKDALSAAEKEADKLDATMKDSKKTFSDYSDAFSKIGDACKKGLAVAAGACVALGGALLATTEQTEEYRNEMAKLSTAFETAGGTADEAKEVYKDLFRVLGDSGQAVEASNHLAKLTTNQEELAEWTNICQGVYATFGDSIPIEGLTEAANETARTGQITGSLADALNWATDENETFGVSLKKQIEFTKLSEKEKKNLTEAQLANYEALEAEYDAIEEYNKAVLECTSAEDYFNIALANCNSEAEREQLIRKTLNGVYDDAAKTYEKNNEAILKQRDAQAKLDEQLAKIGETMQPVNAAFTQLYADVLEQLQPYLEDFAEKYIPKIVEALSDVGTKIGEAISFIADNWDWISTLGAVILGVATALSVVSTVMTVVNAVMYASPVTWIIMAIVAAIAALVAIIVVCVKYWDEIKEACSNAWNSIKTATSNAVKAVSNWFGDMKDKVVKKVTELKDKAVNKFNELKDKATDKVKELKENVSEKVEEIKTKVSDKFNEIKDKVTTKLEETKTNAAQKMEAIKETMGEKMGRAKEVVSQKLDSIKSAYEEKGGGMRGIVNATMEAIKQRYSTEYAAINSLTNGKFGQMVDTIKSKMQGALNTITNILNNIKNRFENILGSAKNVVSNMINKIKNLFNFQWSLPKLKLPHLSITGKFSLSPPSVPKFSIAWYKNGGVFDNPTLFPYGGGRVGGLGEDGAEAIVPLEKNTKWLDRLATMLTDKQGGKQPIFLMVDGKVFGEIAVDSINELTRLKGGLPLKLV